MCGIIGASGQAFLPTDIKRGLEQLHHRGPDEHFFGQDNGFIWGMTRLSIRDLKKGLYPFEHLNLKLIFNGELYNLPELRKLAAKIGFICKTNCDAEVVLPLFKHFGPKSFAMFRGMFALAIYDLEEKTVVLARDRFGEKPLYYYHNGADFFFGSEISAFPSKTKTVSTTSIQRFCNLGFIPQKNTIYTSIFKLQAGHYLRYSRDEKSAMASRYASLVSEAEAIQSAPQSEVSTHNLDHVLNTIVSEKMAADVPVGLFLSGGLDSSLLAAIAQKYNSRPLHSFSAGFLDDQLDESIYSKQVASYLGTNHHHQIVTAKMAKQVWDTTVTTMDEPICDPACIPTFLLAEQARQKVTVVLTGEGADEFFAGYPRYQNEVIASKFASFTGRLLEKVSLLSGSRRFWRVASGLMKHYHSVTYMSTWYGGRAQREQLDEQIDTLWQSLLADLKNPNTISKSALMQFYDLEYYVSDQLCMKNDKMIMKASVESRAPYLDTRLLPWLLDSARLAESGAQPKTLLRQVASKYLPESIVKRKKHGFSLPLDKWLKTDFKNDYISLKSPHPLLTQAVGKEAIMGLVDRFEGGKTELALSVWNSMTINSWLQKNA